MKGDSVSMYQKAVGLIAAGLLFELGFWLQAVMPNQAWGQWDGQGNRAM